MFLDEYRKEFLVYCQIKNLSPRTIETYDRNLTIVFNFLDSGFEIAELDDIERSHLRNFNSFMLEEGYSASYINTVNKVLRSFYNYCVEEGYCEQNIAKRVPFLKEQKVLLTSFNNAEVKRMLAYHSGNSFLSVRNRAMLAVLFDTGVRVSELRNLENDWVGSNFIRILGKGNKWRIVPVSNFLKRELIRYEREKRKYIKRLKKKDYEVDNNYFLAKTCKKISSNVIIEKIVKDCATAVKVRKVVRASPHTCRHYFAITSLKNGIDLYTISKLLGHANLNVTKVYLQSITDEDLIGMSIDKSPLTNLFK